MQGISEIPGLAVEPVHTNIVYFHFAPGTQMREVDLVQGLEQRNVRLLSLGPRRFRAVTHCWVDADDIEVALSAMREVMNQVA